ncbi:MAG: hypothetical protein RL228_608 [Actinomycetota bacterium]|jgi:hypothetical protein
MNKAFKYWAFVLLVILITAAIWKASTLEPQPTSSPSASESITPSPSESLNISGCYVNLNDTNKYVLNILSVEGTEFSAFVGYYNDGFDSSSGTYIGTYKNSILDGIYSFEAEGSDNQRELVFKYVSGDFIAGFGDYEMVDGVERLISLESVKWFPKYTYSRADSCDSPK